MTSPGQNSTRGSQERRRATPEDFLFGKLIGEGSFSCVFLAKEIKTGREVAIKVSFWNFIHLDSAQIVKNCHFYRIVWSFQDLFVTQILREINFEESVNKF